MKRYYVYIIASRRGALYVGVTSSIEHRIWQHKMKLIPGHASKYNIKRLVYLEETGYIDAAIAREKQIKRWRREKKLALIRTQNPDLRDLMTSEIPPLRRPARSPSADPGQAEPAASGRNDKNGGA
jgi:putative endonuclease